MKAIRVRYLSCTNTKPSRLVAEDCDGNRLMMSKGEAQKTHPDNPQNNTSPTDAAALALCRKMDWRGDLIRGEFPGWTVYVFANGPRVTTA